MRFCPPGGRTGTIAVGLRRANHLALQIYGNSSHSTESETPYLTFVVLPYLRFSLPPQAP